MDNNGIDWQVCELTMETTSNYTCSNLPTSSTNLITAIKWQLPDFNSGSRYNVKLTIADINGLNDSILANNLTYISTDSIGVNTMAPIVEVTYLGESLGLAMDKDTLAATIKPNEVTTIPHTITITANTRSGYNLTVNTKDKDNSLVRALEENTDTGINTNARTDNANTNNTTIPAINTEPLPNTTGWAINYGNHWQAVPASGLTLTLLDHQTGGPSVTNTTLNYAIAATSNILAGTYRAELVYTVTGV